MQAANCTNAPSGLVAFWPVDGTASDLIGVNHGSLMNSATFGAGKVVSAFRLNGVNDYVQVPDSALWAFGTNDFTIELWANFAVAGGSRSFVASDAGGGANNKWIFWLEAGLLKFHINGTPGSVNIGTAAFSPATNQWYHLALTRSTTNYIFYIDGAAAATNSDSRSVPDANAPLTIGQAEGNYFFNGLLDEVSIYNRALTGVEIRAIRNADDGGKCRGGLLTRAAAAPYFTDFEAGIGAEWSVSAVDASESSPFTKFSGRFGNSSQSLTVTNLTLGQSYTVGFDFYPIDSWEGNAGPGDYFNVSVNGLQIFHYTFGNINPTQSFPGQPDEGRAHLGFNASYVDSIYRNVEVTFFASNTFATIGFSGQNLEVLDNESWGLDNVSVKLTSALTTTTIRSATLPVQGSTNSVGIDGFSISASRPLLAATAGNAANFSLREAGLNGALGDGDDLILGLTPAFTSGRTVSFTFANSPLQSGRYRFQTTSGLQDTNASAVAVFTRDFTLAHPVLGRIENTANDSLVSATALANTESPAASGFFTAFGVGTLAATSDVDYWRFDGEAGDRVTVRVEAELPGTNPQLQLRNSSDQNLQNIGGNYEGVAVFQNFVLTSPGTFYLRVFSTSRSSRYSLRVDQSRGPQMESEVNDTQAAANTINLTFSPGLYQGKIAGALPAEDAAGDFFRLGMLNVGNAISVTALFPTGSTLTGNQTILSAQVEGNNSPLETSSNGALNFTVTTNAVHFVRVETASRNLRAQYLLNFGVSDGVPPAVTSAGLPGEGTTTASIVDRFTLTFSEEIVGSSLSNSANYELRAAGADGLFDNGDDQVYIVASAGYSGGLAAPYVITDGPLQSGNYRFKVRTNLIDRASNPMAAEFVRNFAVTNVPGLVLENRSNDVGGLATSMSQSPGTNSDGTVSFLGSFGVGVTPYFVVAGRFNSDSNLDLVTANLTSDGISVLAGNGDGTFQAVTNIATGDGALSIAVGAFNTDSNLDLAVANYYAGTVSVLAGNGNGGFVVLSNYSGFNGPRNLAVGDFNQDGNLDLAVPNEGAGTVSVLLGNGGGTFGGRTNYAVGSAPWTVAVGDVNNDGKPDLAVANVNSANVSLLLGNGNGSFQSAVNIATGSGPRSVALAQLNGDTNLDLVVLNANDNTVSVQLGNGNGSFQPRQDFSTGTSDPYNLLLTDLNGDNRLDAVVPGYGNNVIGILLNNGSGSFTNLQTYGSGGNPIAVVAGDYNGDGRRDLAFANYNGNNVSVWLGNRTSPLTEAPSGSGMKSAFVRGNLSSAADLDYYQFSATAGDLLVLAVDAPGNQSGSSLHFRVERPDGGVLIQFNSDNAGWGQSAPLTLPQSGTYLVRVSPNQDFQGEYRLRMTTVSPPTQFETENNDSVGAANLITFSPTNINHQFAKVAGYVSYGDGNGDYFRLGSLVGGTIITLGIQRTASSGLAGILEIYNAAGVTVASNVAGAGGLVFTVPGGQNGAYYARVIAGEIGHGGGPGYTVRLDGVDDYVNTPNFGNSVPNSEVTVEFWQYVTSVKSQFTFALSPDNTGNRFSVTGPWGDGNVYWDFGNIGINGRLNYVPPNSLVGSWQHFALVSSLSGNFMRIYRNGVLEASKTGASSFVPGSFALRIGGLPGTMFGGAIDEFRVWNVARSQTEIQQNRNLRLTGAEAGLVGYWPFDEGTGTNTSDATVFANHGTLVNGAAWGVDGTNAAQPAGLLAQYILSLDLQDVQPPAITGDTLPLEASSATSIIDRISVGFNKDVATNFNALNRVVLTYGGHSYLLTDNAGAWPQAEAQSLALGGHLATINDAAENDWLNQNFSANGDLWIGLNDQAGEGIFAWASGEPFAFSNWQGGQPDNSGNEDFGELWTSGLWNDRGNRIQRGVIEVSSSTDTDGDGLVNSLDPFPTDLLNAFDLRAAGTGGLFDTPDDVVYNLDTTGYLGGTNASFVIVDGPLQVGYYRFKVTSSLKDRYGNALAAPYVRTFTVSPVAGYVLENRSNNVAVAASSFSVAPTNRPDGSLTVGSSLAVAGNPYFVVTGRFNGDTNLDLVTANLNGGGISVLAGSGNGTFQLTTNIATGGGALSLAVGNFNTDTNLDLAVANNSIGTVSVLAGNGTGGFQVLSNYSGFTSPRNLAAGDFNQDGKLDLAVPNEGNGTVSVLLGNGDGTFGVRTNYGVGSGPWTVAVGDVNNDGKADLTVANVNSDNVSLLLGNGNGSFQPALNIPTGANPRFVALGRMNSGDTNLDMVVLNAGDNTVSVLLGNGDGSFQPRVNYAPGSSDPYQVILADLNLDGALDVVVASLGNGRLLTLLNNGDGTLGGVQSYGVAGNPISVVAGDFNGDGRPDLATANYYGNSAAVLLGNPSQPLSQDAGSGLRLGAGRGNLSDNGDEDYWSFSGVANDRLMVASEALGNSAASGLCYTIYRPDGTTLTSFCGDFNGRGQVSATLPVSGTYSVRVTYNYQYYGEYRLRVTLARPPVQLEVESNDSVGAANTSVLSLSAGHQTATILGYVGSADTAGDYFRLGYLAGGSTINLNYSRPASSGLIGVLGIYNSLGGLVATASPGITNLAAIAATNDTYFARMTAASNSAGLFAQYLLNVDVTDATPPTVTSITLPAAATTNVALIDGFTLNFSKDVSTNFNVLNRQVFFYGGHAYLISDFSATWFDVENQARALGGHLATINDAAENSWVRETFNAFGSVWLGLTDEAQEASFIWASGEPFSYTNWNAGEPNNSGNEDYAVLVVNARWNDEGASGNHRGVIEVSGTDTDGDGLPDTLDPYPGDQFNGFDLRAAGTDGLFDTGDDEVYRLTFPTYSSGLALNFTIADGPLQAGNYRFRVTTSLRDRFGNSLSPSFEQFFTLGNLAGFVTENRNNNSSSDATPLALTEDPPGLKTGGGRGNLSDNSDADFWSFSGATGDRFLLVVDVPGNPGASQLHYQVFQPSGSQVLDFYPEYTGGGQSPAITLPTNGTYTVQVTINYGFHDEYRLRVLTAATPLQAENEDNGSFGAATAMTLAVSGNTRFGGMAGVVRTVADLDYINLGTVTNGSTIFLSTRLPAGSTLVPVVSVYSASNVYQSEAPGGRSTDGVAEVPITQNGTYYALVRGGEGTGAQEASYLLDVQVVPTGTVSFPNLQVVAINLPTASGLQSGQPITHSFGVQNIGSLATPGANWLDRVALSLNTTLGDADDIPFGLLAHNGTLNSGNSYTVTNTGTLPDGISGAYYIIVQTDAGNGINEFVFESDNTTVSTTTFIVARAPYADLRVESLTLAGPDGSGGYTVTWNTANRGNLPAPAGFKERFIVRHLTTGTTPVDVELTVASSLAINATLPRLQSFTMTNSGNYRVEITTDSQNNLFEFDATSHASAELNTATTNFSITQLFTVTLQSSPPGAATLTGAGTFQSGSIKTVTAQPNTNVLPYLFVNWTEGAVFQSASTNYTFVLSRDRTLVANLTLPSYQLAASNNPPTAGSVSGQGTFFHGTTNLLTATANFGYAFTNWTENGGVISLFPNLTNVVTSNRFVVANYAEANTFHVVTTATSPTNLTALAGAGTYGNGQSFAFIAPASVTNPPNLYNFDEWRANGAFVSGSASFNKTFSTLDPTNLQFVAHYETVSILPLITNVTINLAQPIPATTNFQVSLQFNRTMNTNFAPLVALTNSGGGAQPVVPPGGTWSAVSLSNDTFTPPPITFSTGMDGTNNIFVSLARDLGGGQLALTNVLQLRVDVTPPLNPALSLTASNNSSATVNWSGYAAPTDLDGFRVFIATSNFTSTAGRVPVSAVGAGTRQFTYSSLSLDQLYYAAVAAVDVAGNSSPTVTPLVFSLPSSTPPPVPVQVQAVGAASAFVSWNSYDTATLLGFAGFRLYYETNNFFSVSSLTPRQTLGPGARSVQIDNLDRTRTYYFAVVGFNGNNTFNSNVTTAAWSDPLAGNITANLTIGGPGQIVDILQNITVINNAVLTVPANATLRFAPGTGLTVQQGALHADGTALDPIYFTSANDQPGLTPAAGDWAGVTLGSGAGASVLRHVFIKYDADLTISNCAPIVEAFTALYNTGAGLNLLGTATLTTSDALLAFNDIGARQFNSAQLILRNSVIKNNGTNAHAAGSASLIATQNWWGSAVAGEIDAGLQGPVNRSGFLASEPLLTPAIGTSNNITQTGSRDVNLRLACRTADAMRLSEDSTFPGVFFTPFTNAVAFQLSEGGGTKTVFAQFRSITGQTSAPVNVTIAYITAGPTISAFSLTEGQVLNRPLLVTGSASAPLGMAAMEFYVDNIGQTTNAGGNFSQWFDVRNFSAAIHRVKLLARDAAGNFATLERNVAITPLPPPAPAIMDPPADIAVNTNTVRIAGTAEPFVEVRLFRSGTILGITNASAAGTFSFANVPLIEGLNPLSALAIDSLGSAGSPVRTVVRDTVPPAALILDPPVYIYGNGLTLTWHFPATGKRANTFEVFWHTAPITSTNQASGHTLRTPGTQFIVQGLATANYYFYVVGYDDVGNASPLSAPVQFFYDGVPPAFTVTFDKPSPVGVGPVRVTVTSSKPISGVPSTTVQPNGSAPALLTLTNTALNTFEGAINVTPLLPSGPVVLNVSAQDTAGNPFNGPPSGAALSIDVRAPSGAISTAPVPPVQATNDTAVAVNLRLTEAPKAGTVPTLNFGPPAGAGVPVTMSGNGTNWNGTLTITPAMGSGIGHFTLTVNDALDNVGHSITAGSALEIYNTGLPTPPGQPVGFQVASLSGGRVQLNWLAISNAEIYRVYSAAGTNLVAPTNLVADNVISNSYIDLPPTDGFHRYVVSALRRGAEGPNSIVRVALSDRTPPSAPTGVLLQLVAAGLQVGWQAGPGQAADHYNVYRNGTLIRTVGAGTTSLIDTPPRGVMSYTVAAGDALGNEALSGAAVIELLVGAVDNLQALVNVGGAPMLSWVSSDPTVVAFNVYRNGIKQNAAPLVGTDFTDVLPPAGLVVTYSVRALNATNAESAARTVNVYAVDLDLLMNASAASISNPPTGRYFDNYHVSVSNLTTAGALPLRQIEVRRTSTAGPFNLVSVTGNSLGAGGGLTRDLAVPCATDNSAQLVRLRAVQETDVGGSSVIYQRTFDFPTVEAPGVMMEVSANNLPLAGGLNSFEVRVFNRGYTTMYLATSRGNGSDPGDLYVLVRNPQGQEVSRQPFTGSPAGIIFSGGVGYVPLAPGASFRVTVPNVLVPEALSSNLVTFEAVASAIYDRFSADGQQQSGPLNGSMQSSLAQTPYYGTAQTDFPLYSNDQPILITGQARDRLTGLPRANVALKIGFATRGFRWYRDVTTDANGNYSYTYNVGPGLAGSLTIWAAHPDVVDQLNQAQINIYRIYATPAAGDIRMSKNDTLDFSISLLNPGDQALSSFTVGVQVYELQGTNQVATTKVTGSLLSAPNFSVAAGQRETINLQLAAAADAPDNALAVFTFTSGEGAVAVFTGNVTLLAPVPIITVVNPDIGYVEVSLDRGKLLSRTVTIANRGLKDLKGVTLLPPTNKTWMVLNLPANPDGSIPLADLEVGGSNSFTVVFTPPADTALGFHQDKILVRGTNAPGTLDVNLYARITSDQFGAVQFWVDNILGFDVPNATVRLRNTSLQIELPPAYTDINGLVTITNLQEGDWSWQVNAPGHSANVGVVQVIPSQTVQVTSRLNKSVVTVNFSVVPVPFTDRYEIRLEQTFETHVPLPVLVMTPSYVEFNNVAPGFEASYIVTAKNEGLIQMENLTITGSHSDSATFTPLITYVPVLLPQQTIEIPFHVTYSGTNAPSQQSNPLADCLPNPLGFMDDLIPFAEGLAAIANAEGRCVRDNTALLIAGTVAMTMRIIADVTSVLASIPEQIAAYVGCVLGSLLAAFGGFGGAGSGSGASQQESVQNFVPTGNGCFAAETRVLLADGRFKTIAEIKPGDMVKTGPGPNDVAHVVEAMELTSTKVREVQFTWPGRNRSDSLRTTDEHLFWEDGQGWVEAQKLKVGDWLLDEAARRVQVTENRRIDGHLQVFTFRLREDPAFYANGVLVHDLCGWWTPEGPVATPTRGPPDYTPVPPKSVKMK